MWGEVLFGKTFLQYWFEIPLAIYYMCFKEKAEESFVNVLVS